MKFTFGYIELKQFHKFENGQMVSYGYSIQYNRQGEEISRTEPGRLSSIGWGDGTPFAENDLRELAQ